MNKQIRAGKSEGSVYGENDYFLDELGNLSSIVYLFDKKNIVFEKSMHIKFEAGYYA